MIYNILMLTAVVIGVYMQNVLQKQYALKCGSVKNSNYIFYLMMIAAETLAFGLLAVFFFEIDGATLARASLFAISFGTCIVFQLLAIGCGSLALTALAVSFSLTVPTLYGVAFLGERLSLTGYIGLGIVAVSLVLVNLTGKSEKKFSFKWLLFSVLAFAGNGICSTIQKIQQTAIGTEVSAKVSMGFSVSFMLFAMLILCVVFGVLCIAVRPPKAERVFLVKKGALPAMTMGLINGACNMLILILAGRMDAVYMYPTITAGGIILTFVTALLLFKERFKPWQYIGYALGILSVVLLSI